MSIYKLNNKQLKKQIEKFSKKTYGKTVFLLAYIIPFFAIFFSILFMIMSFIICPSYYWNSILLLIFFPIAFIITFISFVLGSRYYYKELREYVNK